MARTISSVRPVTTVRTDVSHALYSAVFYLSKTGSPTGTAVAKLYAMTGTFGTTATPTGAALATSETLDVTTLTASYELKTFLFTGINAVALTSANYCISVEYSTGGNVSDTVRAGNDSVASHAGKGSRTIDLSTWTVIGPEYCFYVYGGASGATLIDSYSESNQDGGTTMYTGGVATQAVAQSFAVAFPGRNASSTRSISA